ncbi:MAG: hypothetical protein AAB384_03835 [Patescibacteria group bacterium]
MKVQNARITRGNLGDFNRFNGVKPGQMLAVEFENIAKSKRIDLMVAIASIEEGANSAELNFADENSNNKTYLGRMAYDGNGHVLVQLGLDLDLGLEQTRQALSALSGAIIQNNGTDQAFDTQLCGLTNPRRTHYALITKGNRGDWSDAHVTAPTTVRGTALNFAMFDPTYRSDDGSSRITGFSRLTAVAMTYGGKDGNEVLNRSDNVRTKLLNADTETSAERQLQLLGMSRFENLGDGYAAVVTVRNPNGTTGIYGTKVILGNDGLIEFKNATQLVNTYAEDALIEPTGVIEDKTFGGGVGFIRHRTETDTKAKAFIRMPTEFGGREIDLGKSKVVAAHLATITNAVRGIKG